MEPVKCNLCGSQDSRKIFSVYDWYWYLGGPYIFEECCKCGLVFLNPRPAQQEADPSMWELWSVSEQSKDWIGSPELARKTYPEIIEYINKRNNERGRLFEIGCGEGGFIKACQQDGWQVYGLDISAECVAYAKNTHKLDNVFVGDFLEFEIEDAQFDVVIMNHLIEHLPDPRSNFEKIHRILKPGGILCISTPNIRSFQVKIFGKYWMALFVPFHLVLFSPQTLTLMLTKNGYSEIVISHFSRMTNTYILLRSLSCVIGLAIRKVRKLFGWKGIIDQPVLSSRSKELLVRKLYRSLSPIISLCVFPIIYFEGITRQGASITVYATKKSNDT